MKNRTFSFSVLLALVFMASCQESNDPAPAWPEIQGEKSKSEKARPKTMIWADGILYESVVTPATFDGDKGNYDRLYAGSFLNGVALITESKPGDQDYNGGRWDLYVLKAGVTTDYSMASSDQDLDPKDFVSAASYFSCPLLPRKNK